MRINRPEIVALTSVVLRWSLLGAAVGVLAGAASALFLWTLDLATRTREAQPGLLFLLPVAGALIGYVYAHHGREAVGGNNLLLERIHDPSGIIPFRMAPLILASTVVTHLFGGSAGREGTAVQMGGTLADLFVKPLRLTGDDRRILLMAGIAAGFGSVFGTPLAGTIFGLEVLTIGRIRYDGLVPCLVAAIVGDVVCRGIGIHHHVYAAPYAFTFTPALAGWIVLAAFLFALAAVLFIESVHWIQNLGRNLKGAPYLRPTLGGLGIVGLTLLVGTQTYNGLGIPLIERSFLGDVPLYAFLLKILFTAVTLGSGFKGGEVTPLFCIGATLGSAFAQVTHQDPALFAALGFAAVFAGAANTPLACAMMGIELFGAHLAVPLAITCVLAYLLSGHRGIYASQGRPSSPTV
jgi:H+/Cl- antiporter ClcA